MDILNAISDPRVFGEHFQRDPETWQRWIVFLATLFALPMTDEQIAIYQQCTGRSTPPTTPFFEAWLCSGVVGQEFHARFVRCVLSRFSRLAAVLRSRRDPARHDHRRRPQAGAGLLRYVSGSVEGGAAVETTDFVGNARVDHAAQQYPDRDSYSLVPINKRLHNCCRSGRRNSLFPSMKTPASRTLKSSTPSSRAWRRYPARAYSVHLHLIAAAGLCLKLGRSTSARTAIRCWFGKQAQGS